MESVLCSRARFLPRDCVERVGCGSARALLCLLLCARLSVLCVTCVGLLSSMLIMTAADAAMLDWG